MKYILVLILLATSITCEAEELTIIHRPISADIIYSPWSYTGGSHGEPCSKTDHPATSASILEHIYMLSGADFKLILAPLNLSDNLSGWAFAAEFMPTKPAETALCTTTFTEVYDHGETIYSTATIATYQDEPVIVEGCPDLTHGLTPDYLEGDTTEGFAVWMVSAAVPHNPIVPVPISYEFSSDTPPRIKITIPGTYTRLMEESPGILVLKATSPDIDNYGVLMRLPIEFYPTVTRLP